MSKQPIGIFDSGVGGLTVYRSIRQHFPNEDLLYFGDTARVPYGPKSRQNVIEYSLQNARFLMQQNVKMLVIACNTSSAVALDVLQEISSVPVIGVIQPGAEAALEATKSEKIGVIGTEGTVRSAAYTKAIQLINPLAEVFNQACPLFVSIVEEGWETHPVAKSVAETYLEPLLNKGIDTIVLGCTHYPILKNVIQDVVGSSIRLVDSADAIIHHLQRFLEPTTSDSPGKDSFFVSDNEDKFERIASRILSQDVTSLRRVRLAESWFIDK